MKHPDKCRVCNDRGVIMRPGLPPKLCTRCQAGEILAESYERQVGEIQAERQLAIEEETLS